MIWPVAGFLMVSKQKLPPKEASLADESLEHKHETISEFFEKFRTVRAATY
jgi:hypothetical protein